MVLLVLLAVPLFLLLFFLSWSLLLASFVHSGTVWNATLFHFSSDLTGTSVQSHQWEAYSILSFYATLHRSFMTPKDTSAFQLLVIYLCSTHVKLEIHLSLPDNNVQNGASCMNHYLQPGVALLMNIHEARDGKRDLFNLFPGGSSDGSVPCLSLAF